MINVDYFQNNMKTKNILINKSTNLGIEILRAYMSFSIVILHFLKYPYNTNNFTKFVFYCQPFYVRIFFLISFYFSYNTFISRNIAKIKERFIRVLIPYIFWPVFIWIWNIINNYKTINRDYMLIQFKSLFLQILIGCDFYPVFWFHFDLIIISIVIIIIIFSFNNYFLFIFEIICPLFYIINKSWEEFISFYKHICSIRPLLESFIYSLSGFFLGAKSTIILLKKKKFIIFS